MHITQEQKTLIAPAIQAICKKYDVSASLAIRLGMTLVLNIKSSPIDFGAETVRVNPYFYQSTCTGTALKFFDELVPAMMQGNNYILTNYQSGWFIDVNIGSDQFNYKLKVQS